MRDQTAAHRLSEPGFVLDQQNAPLWERNTSASASASLGNCCWGTVIEER